MIIIQIGIKKKKKSTEINIFYTGIFFSAQNLQNSSSVI